MTVVVAFNGTLAADSQTTMQGAYGRNSIKVNKLTGVSFSKKNIPIVAYACAGAVLDIAEFDILIRELYLKNSKATFKLEDILSKYEGSLINKNLSILFMTSTGGVIHVVINKLNIQSLKIKPKNEMTVMGSGNSICGNLSKDIKEQLTAAEYAYVASKFAQGCGGPISYINIKNLEVNYFKPNQLQRRKLVNWVTTVLFD